MERLGTSTLDHFSQGFPRRSITFRRAFRDARSLFAGLSPALPHLSAMALSGAVIARLVLLQNDRYF
jgi:hypothetical protein